MRRVVLLPLFVAGLTLFDTCLGVESRSLTSLQTSISTSRASAATVAAGLHHHKKAKNTAAAKNTAGGSTSSSITSEIENAVLGVNPTDAVSDLMMGLQLINSVCSNAPSGIASINQFATMFGIDSAASPLISTNAVSDLQSVCGVVQSVSSATSSLSPLLQAGAAGLQSLLSSEVSGSGVGLMALLKAGLAAKNAAEAPVASTNSADDEDEEDEADSQEDEDDEDEYSYDE